MSFPLQIGQHIVEDAPELSLLAAQDARAGGGTVFPGEGPETWVLRLPIERYLLVGFAMGCVRTSQRELVLCGARIAARLKESRREWLEDALRAYQDDSEVQEALNEALRALDESQDV